MPQRRIVVLVDNIESDYQVELISGILRATRFSSINVVIAAGGWISTDDYPTARNFLYDFIPAAQVAGLVVLAGSLSNHCGLSAFTKWLDRFGSIPIVCIGPQIEGRASVSVDNGIGMHAAVKHLIEAHGRRKIGFLKGPEASAEAAERYAAYEQALREHDLPIDPALQVTGNTLGREDGQAAIRELFDVRHLQADDLDALAGVNDDVTLGALEALTQRGIAVPETIALVGFDDTRNAASANPPLTTVNQRVEQQGHAAATTLLRSLKTGEAAHSSLLASQAVVRASCGCEIPYANDSSGVTPSGRAGRLALSLLGRSAALNAEMARSAKGRIGKQNGWEERLGRALIEDLQGSRGVFCHALEKLTRRAIAEGGNVDAFNDVVTVLRLQVLRVASTSHEERSLVEDLFQEARLMLTSVGLAAYRERDQAAAAHQRNILKTCVELLSTGQASALSRALSEHLPPLGVSACAVSRLVESAHRGKELELVAHVSPDFGATRRSRMATATLGLDSTLEHGAAVVMMPLDFAQQPIGLAGFAWGAHNPLVYEQLREALSFAVHAVDREAQQAPEARRSQADTTD